MHYMVKYADQKYAETCINDMQKYMNISVNISKNMIFPGPIMINAVLK